MKKSMILLVSLFSFSVLNAQELKNAEDSLSYAVGILWGQAIKQQGITSINTDVVGHAIGDALNGEEGKMDIKAANNVLRSYMEEKKAIEKNKNMAEGEAFLRENAKRETVVTLPSGLQYEIIREGSGNTPIATDRVTVHYEGRLIDGTVFDSSVQRGEPATFGVTQVIKGWVEALQLMQVGAKWKLYIPQDLAYGDRGAGGQIGPYATLIFDVELLGIE